MKFKFVSGNSLKDVKVYLDDKDITTSCMEVKFIANPSSAPVVELKLYPESVEIESNAEVKVIRNTKGEPLNSPSATHIPKDINICINGYADRQTVDAIGKEMSKRLNMRGITC